MSLSLIILINFKKIWSNFTLRIILIILICYIVAFSVGVGNFVQELGIDLNLFFCSYFWHLL